MSKWFAPHDIERMDDDWKIAEERMQAIAKELRESSYVNPRYLIEKASVVKSCMEFIMNMSEEAMRSDC